VQTKEGDLGEQLVAKGLARIYGRSATPPGASSSAVERQRLKGLEDEAKRLKLGGWAANIGVSTPQIEAPHEKGNSASVAPFSPSHKIAPSATPTAVATPSTSFSVTPLPATPIPSPRKDGDAGKLDVNTATEKQLRDLPGIGPVMARRIIDARPFRSADDLKKVNGIGDKKYAEIRLYFQ
jgi:predicted flap endonuclease-1-like 5' DNA nuclease